ncbi:MAG: zf-HC2 domain-containing protein, partial [Thermoanaerobaculales bacterium]|nr:zf-HC2 domain-containing protein [Thermoanaerobaculales bacterium]
MLRPADSVDCAEVLDRLEALLDAEVDPGAAAELQAHLERCPSCREEWRRAGEIRAALRSLPRFEAPPRVGAALAAAAAGVCPRRERRSLMRARPAMIAAALAAAAALVVWLAPVLRAPRPAVSAAEARAAAGEARLALGVLATVAQRTQGRVHERVLGESGLGTTLRSVSRSLRWAREAGAA